MSRCKNFDKNCNIVSSIHAHDGFEWDRDMDRLLIRDRDA
jgi:hypothetical protein